MSQFRLLQQKYYRLGGLNKKYLFLKVLEARKSKIEVRQMCGLVRTASWFTDCCLLLFVSHMAFHFLHSSFPEKSDTSYWECYFYSLLKRLDKKENHFLNLLSPGLSFRIILDQRQICHWKLLCVHHSRMKRMRKRERE